MSEPWQHILASLRQHAVTELFGGFSPRERWNVALMVSKTQGEVTQALNQGADPNSSDGFFVRSLMSWDRHFAGNREQAMERLLEAGLNCEQTNAERKTLLHECGYEGIAHMLLDEGTPTDVVDLYGYTPLQAMCANHYWHAAGVLIERGCVFGRNDKLVSAAMAQVLHLLRQWHLWDSRTMNTVLRHLLSCIPKQTLNHCQVRHQLVGPAIAAKNERGELAWVEQLHDTLDIGAKDTDFQWDELLPRYPKVYDRAPLWWAASCNDVVVVKYLIDARTDVTQIDQKGQTALHAAVSSHALDVVHALLEAGADPNAQDKDGKTPLHLIHDAKLQVLDIYGYDTDLILCALLKWGANPSITDRTGARAGSACVVSGHPHHSWTEFQREVTSVVYNRLLEEATRQNLFNSIAQAVELTDKHGGGRKM